MPAQSSPAGEGAEQGSRLMVWLLAVGVCTLAIWVMRRINRPRKVLLHGTPGRPNTLNPLHIVAVILAWVGANSIAAPLLMKVLPVTRAHILLAVLAPIILAGASLLAASRCFRWGIRAGLGLNLRHWLYDTARAVVGYLAAWPVVFALLVVGKLLAPSEEHELLRAAKELDGLWLAMVILSAVVLAPLGEELFFRGLMQSMLRRYLKKPWLAVIATSAFFAVIHRPYWDTMGGLFVLGLVLGYVYERCGRLYPAILLHAIFNGMSMLMTITGW